MIATRLPMPSGHGVNGAGGAVLKGDLSATPLSDVLTDLAAQAATGCLHIDDDSGDEALVYLKNGLVYSAYVPGRRPQLGARLISSGALAPEALAEALDAQATELQGWRLGELLVHLGYVERPVVEAFVLEQLRESCFDLSRWTTGRYRFRKNEKTREDVGSHAAVADLLAEVVRRRGEWEVISGVVHGPSAIPVLSAGGLGAAEMTLDQDQWALLCKVDGERTIAQLARDCGFTTFEAGQIVYTLVGAGLLDVEETFEGSFEPEAPASGDDDALATLQRISSALFVPLVPGQAESYDWADDAPDAGSEISRLLGAPAESEPALSEPEPEPEPESASGSGSAEPVEELALPTDLRSELASLTAAIADLPSLALPETPEPPVLEDVAEPVVEAVVEPDVEVVAEDVAEDPFGDSLARVSEALSALLGDALPPVAMREPPKAAEPTPEELERAREEAERTDRSRAAAAAELAEAHAMAEAARAGRSGPRFGQRAKAAAEEAARAEAERVAAEEAARLAAETAEAERVAAEEAARLAAETAEAERVAAEEAAQAATEEAARVAAEEAERIEAERAEAERIEAERAEAERIEAERAEAERAEAERVAAEEAAEAERVAAEEGVRIEAERAEAERVEAERVEAERVEAERVAAEAERLEAERVEAERAEAERLEAERVEAERVAAELAAEEAAEAERLAGEQAAADETERLEAEPVAEPANVSAFDVASLLRDLNDTAPEPTPDPAPEEPIDTVETIEEYVPEDRPTGADPAPAFANGSRAGLSETAALLRELTSLGLDDEPEPTAPAARMANAAATPPKPATPAKEQPKKRKGLFGRG
jgi:hypothetical protein